jgi:plastocyanin
MRLRTLTTAGIALALATTLAACGGDDDKDSAAQGTNDAAASSDPMAGGNLSPGTGDDAYAADDQFANPGAKCPKGGEPKNTITASGNTFCAKSYSGLAGSTWTFDNPDIAIHNVATDDFEKNPAKFKSPDVEQGKKDTFKMPKKTGKYTIICTYHPGSMTAKLTLK